MHAIYVTHVHYISNIRTQPTTAVILFATKSEQIFQDAIMLVK